MRRIVGESPVGVKNGKSRFFPQQNKEFLKMPQRCICGVFMSISVVVCAVRVVGGVLCCMRVFVLGVASRVPRERADVCLVMFSEVDEQKDKYGAFYERSNAFESGDEQNGRNDGYRDVDESTVAVPSSLFRERRKGNYEALYNGVAWQDFCWLGCASGWRTLPQREGANFSSGRMADPGDEHVVHQLKGSDGMGQEFMIKSLRYNVSSVNIDVAEEFSLTSELGVDNAQEIVGLVSFSSIILADFSRVFSIDVSMIVVSSVETASAGAVPSALDVIGSGLSTSTISGGSTRRIGSWCPRREVVRVALQATSWKAPSMRRVSRTSRSEMCEYTCPAFGGAITD